MPWDTAWMARSRSPHGFLGLPAGGDVLHLADVLQGPALCVAHQGNVRQAPEDVPVAVQVALLHLKEFGLSGLERHPAGQTFGQVVGMGDVGQRQGQHLLRRAAEQAGEGSVDAHEAVAGIRQDHGHVSVLEGAAEQLLGAPALGRLTLQVRVGLDQRGRALGDVPLQILLRAQELGVAALQLGPGPGQLYLRGLQRAPGDDDLLARGHEQVEDLLLFGGNAECLALEGNLDAGLAGSLGAAGLAGEEVLHAAEQDLPFNGLADEVVGAALEAAHDVRWFAEHGDQDDRHVAARRVVLDCAAQLEAGQPRQKDVGDDQVEVGAGEASEPFLPVAGKHHVKTRFLQQALQALGLHWTVFHHEYPAHLLVPSGVPHTLSRYKRADCV
jgi:hypothetical protein